MAQHPNRRMDSTPSAVPVAPHRGDTFPDTTAPPLRRAALRSRVPHHAGSICTDKETLRFATAQRSGDKLYGVRFASKVRMTRRRQVPPASAGRTNANPPTSPRQIPDDTGPDPNPRCAEPRCQLAPARVPAPPRTFAHGRGACSRSATVRAAPGIRNSIDLNRSTRAGFCIGTIVAKTNFHSAANFDHRRVARVFSAGYFLEFPSSGPETHGP